MPGATSRRIVITAYDGISLLDLAGPLEASRVASTFGGPRGRLVTYECSVVSVRGGPVKTADGVALVTDSVRALSRMQIDTLIVPGAFFGGRCDPRPRFGPVGQEEGPHMQAGVLGVHWQFPACRSRSAGWTACCDPLDARAAASHAASASGCGARRDICARWQSVVFRRRDDGHRFGPCADRGGCRAPGSKTLCHHRLISAIVRNGAAGNDLILFTPCRIDGP